jgi:HD superfamily phosphohydrolase|tara:strand:+ start:10642 stop:11883 length:1242 start_codon:yes stop_codon:yes gene_type:complete
MHSKKRAKIINDPIYGFIEIESGIINSLINHPYFQRLRRISQLGLSYLVYPGAQHTRFQHALGCLHLVSKATQQLLKKGHKINQEEQEAVKIAILLHDIGHGPFSHALERTLVANISHEELSLIYMHKLNEEFNGKLSLAIKIFKNKYKKKFLHQLVSSQLDMDRLDYLKRDSFFTGVTEGNVGVERIISMLDVKNDNLVIEEKGIYSIEKFIIARRLMYWQVYLHKTVISAENMLIQLLMRAKYLIRNSEKIYISSNLKKFLCNDIKLNDFKEDNKLLNNFSQLDDSEIYSGLKYWSQNKDFVLSKLSNDILNRNILKIKVQKNIFNKKHIKLCITKMMNNEKISKEEAEYFIFSDKVSNSLYSIGNSNINILFKNGEIKDLSKSSDQFNLVALSKTINKYFLCSPKEYIVN